MNFSEVVSLYGAKKSGKEYRTKCPAHADSDPSLYISPGDKGTVLLCRAGCNTEAILAAKGLVWADVFDEPSKKLNPYKPVKVYKKPIYKPTELEIDPRARLWFAGRGITDEVLLANKIEHRKVWMPQINGETGAVCFPYFRDGDVVNVKYRDGLKNFRLESEAELILYGYDSITREEPLYWVEGEIDALSLDVAGFNNRVSVPNGAPSAASKTYERELPYLESAQDILSGVVQHVIAVDNDGPGRALSAELIRRLGPEKCYTVSWPSDCKDANDVLQKFGVDRLKECLSQTRAVPIAGIYNLIDFEDNVVELWRNGMPGGEHPGSEKLAEFYRPRVGEWTVVTGIPSMGKSQWVNWLTINLAKNLDWQFAVCSPENQPLERHAAELLACYAGLPFGDGPSRRMNEIELNESMVWLNDHFVFLLPDEDVSIDNILELARIEVFRRGIKGLVIDPWNEFDHTRERGMSLTEYVGKTLIKVRQFARRHQIHVWVVAHPAKLVKDKTGDYPVPTPYDISDSAHWRNKADMCVTVHRDVADESKAVQIHVQKVRFRENGKVGMCELYYDVRCGRYLDGAISGAGLRSAPWEYNRDV